MLTAFPWHIGLGGHLLFPASHPMLGFSDESSSDPVSGRIIQNLTDAVCLFWGESHAVTDAVVHQIVSLPFLTLAVGAFGKALAC